MDDGRVRTMATPLFVVLMMVETTDLVFAVDSIPAVFAITRDPFLVFTSNVFAILGLRSMYFLLAGAIDRFAMLKYGLALVLVFVGLKMVWLNDAFGGKFPIEWSLLIIAAILGSSIVASLVFGRKAADPVTSGPDGPPASTQGATNPAPSR